jgi:hypothetical protein
MNYNFLYKDLIVLIIINKKNQNSLFFDKLFNKIIVINIIKLANYKKSSIMICTILKYHLKI